MQIADVQGPVGFMVLMLTQSFPEMFPEPDEHKNYQLGNTNVTYHHGKVRVQGPAAQHACFPCRHEQQPKLGIGMIASP